MSKWPEKGSVQPGDLIMYVATPRDALITRLVGAFQLIFGAGRRPITYSHVAIASYTPGQQHESKWPCSGRFPIDKTRKYEVWRLKGGLPIEMQARILNDCMAHAGEMYPIDTLLTFGLITHRHAMVCSQWAAARYAAAGIRFNKEGFKIVAPDVMLDSGYFEKVAEGGRRDV